MVAFRSDNRLGIGEGCGAVSIEQDIGLGDVQSGVGACLIEVALYDQDIAGYHRLVVSNGPELKDITTSAFLCNGISFIMTDCIGFTIADQLYISFSGRSVSTGRCIVVVQSKPQITGIVLIGGAPLVLAVSLHHAAGSFRYGLSSRVGGSIIFIQQNVCLADVQSGIGACLIEASFHDQDITGYHRLVVSDGPELEDIPAVVDLVDGISCGMANHIGFAITDQLHISFSGRSVSTVGCIVVVQSKPQIAGIACIRGVPFVLAVSLHHTSLDTSCRLGLGVNQCIAISQHIGLGDVHSDAVVSIFEGAFHDQITAVSQLCTIQFQIVHIHIQLVDVYIDSGDIGAAYQLHSACIGIQSFFVHRDAVISHGEVDFGSTAIGMLAHHTAIHFGSGNRLGGAYGNAAVSIEQNVALLYIQSYIFCCIEELALYDQDVAGLQAIAAEHPSCNHITGFGVLNQSFSILVCNIGGCAVPQQLDNSAGSGLIAQRPVSIVRSLVLVHGEVDAVAGPALIVTD